eukprot:gb/GECG01015171.1/.p1 GENE.gb/GECG01015171.1/~~gb/GECG01015171.1/.p1  ORF type:complete len:531 (+),score=34.74 gb/GECG01015171.1/:1-1593(+)
MHLDSKSWMNLLKRYASQWAIANRRYVVFGAVMLGSSLMNNLFVTYYIMFFTQIEVLDSSWFYIGQIVFAIWNAINDPLFGWLSDNAVTAHSRTVQRLRTVRIGGYVWVVSFVLLWYPWSTPFGFQSPRLRSLLAGLHFITSLILYDGGLSYVEVNHGALLTEIASTSQERARFNMWSAIWAGIGSLSSLFAHIKWDKDDLSHFQFVVWIVALISVVSFEVSTRQLEGWSKHYSPAKSDTKQVSLEHRRKHMSKRDKEVSPKSSATFSMFISQLMNHRNFMIFAALSAIQAFDCTFEKNFFAAFMDSLAGSRVSPELRGSVISASFLLPHACTVIATPAIRRWGMYDTMQGLLIVRIGFVVAAMATTVAMNYVLPSLVWISYGICGFMLINRVASEATCRLFPLILSDLIDEDSVINNRSKGLSSSIIGTASFTSKISQSLAPMVGFYVTPIGSLSSSLPPEEYGVESAKRVVPTTTGLWWILLVIPVLCILLELMLWKMYTLRGKYLKRIQKTLSKQEETIYEPSEQTV